MRTSQKENRLGMEKLNNQGYLMRIVEYNNANNIVVEFQDEYKTKIKTFYKCFCEGSVWNPSYRIGETSINHQGCLMKIIEYVNSNDIIVEFQDDYKGRVHTHRWSFLKGNVKNPYYPMVLGVGMLGSKYPSKINNKETKEYNLWKSMLYRCFDKNTKDRSPTYESATCCDEWLLYENFYEWLHKQENFDKWGDNRWNIDKDILVKGNKIYSPETCFLVPCNVNSLFTNKSNYRGDLPIGVKRSGNSFLSRCSNPITGNREYLGSYSTPYYAFFAYKKYKENLIKQIAQLEYSMGNITKRCCDAMMNYKVEITD